MIMELRSVSERYSPATDFTSEQDLLGPQLKKLLDSLDPSTRMMLLALASASPQQRDAALSGLDGKARKDIETLLALLK
jgi:hypothetical protein